MERNQDGLMIFNYADILDWGPCYDPIKHIPENWTGTAIDILNIETVSVPDRLWVVLRTQIVSEKVMRLFAVWCARQVQHLMTDSRSLVALDVAERFANGEATDQERAAAGAAAGSAAWAAAGAAAWAAAWAAARAAARAAAWAAARAAAGAAARAAAGSAAWAAAGAAARAAAGADQIAKLKEMILIEAKTF